MSYQARLPKSKETQSWNKPILDENRVGLCRKELTCLLPCWNSQETGRFNSEGPRGLCSRPAPPRSRSHALTERRWAHLSHLPQRQGLGECRFDARCVERILGWKLPSSLEKSCCGIPQATLGAGPIFLYQVIKISQVCTSLANLNLNKYGGLLKLQWHYETSSRRFLRPFLSPVHFLPDWRRCHFQSFLLLLKECQVGASGISPFPFVSPEPAREVLCRNWRLKWSHYRGVRLSLPHGCSSAMIESSGASITGGGMDIGSRQPCFKFRFDLLGCVTLVE